MINLTIFRTSSICTYSYRVNCGWLSVCLCIATRIWSTTDIAISETLSSIRERPPLSSHPTMAAFLRPAERHDACRAREFFAFYRFIIRAGSLAFGSWIRRTHETAHEVESRRPLRMCRNLFLDSPYSDFFGEDSLCSSQTDRFVFIAHVRSYFHRAVLEIAVVAGLLLNIVARLVSTTGRNPPFNKENILN